MRRWREKKNNCLEKKKMSMNQKMEHMKKKEMDLRQIEEIVKDPNAGGVIQKKETLISTLSNSNHPDPINNNKNVKSTADHSNTEPPIDSGSALQLFLDHIPITSIPSIKNFSSILELKTQDHLVDAIRLLYERNTFGAPVADNVDSIRSFTDGYIGFIDLASLVLWSLEASERHYKSKNDNNISRGGFFSMLQKIPRIGQTKIGELGKSFLWSPFFPVNLEDTLFHVLLLLSKHRLHVVPVICLSESKIVGFVTQIAVMHILLQSSGLEWFDNIADKALSEFRFEYDNHVISVYEDQSIGEAMHVLWKKQIVAVAVLQRKTQMLVGCIRSSDVYLLLGDNNLFDNIRTVSVGHFIKTHSHHVDLDPAVKRNPLVSAATLTLRNKDLPKMDSPVTNKRSDTLKEAMRKLVETNAGFSFLIDQSQQVRGMLTLRDIIIQFAPPCVDSRINGGGFFDTALEQSGCHVDNGKMIRNH